MGSSYPSILFGPNEKVGTVVPVPLSDFDKHFVSQPDVGGR